MARGVDGRDTFVDDQDRRLFLTALTELKQEAAFTLFAYCLMGNHFHLAIKIGEAPLSHIMQRLLTRYVSAFNARHGRTGHLFQARYKAVLCLKETQLLRLIEYIHANPVRSGMVAKAEDWGWSSCEVYSNNRRSGLVDPHDLPRTLGSDDNPRTVPDDFDPWPKNSRPEPLLLRNHPTERASLESLARHASSDANISVDVLCSKRREQSIAQVKRAFIARCLREGHSLSDISRWLRCSPSAVHYLAYGEKNLKELKA